MERIREFLFTNKSVGQIVIKNTFWLTVSSTVSKIIRSIMVIYAARILGAEQYGIFSYALSIGSICFVFADIGLSPLLIREYVKQPEHRAPFTANVAAAKSFLILLSLLLMLFASPVLLKIEAARPLLPLFAILLSLDSLRSFGFSIFRARNKMEIEAKLDIFTEIISTILGLSILVFIPSISNLLIGYIISSGIGFTMIIITAGGFKPIRIIQKISLSRIFPILKSVIPYAIISAFGMLMTNIDMFFVGYFLDAKAAGFYAAALRPMSILYLIPNFISAGIFPIINNFIKNNENSKLKTVVEKGMKIGLAIAIPIIVGGVILSYPIIRTIFGAEYVSAVSTFQFLLITLLFIFPGFIANNILFSKEDSKTPLIATGIAAISNVVLDIILIPLFGIKGSAIATLIAQLILNGILLIKVRKLIGISPFPHMSKIMIATIIMSIITIFGYYLSIPLVLLVPISAIIYGTSLYILREPLFNDIKSTVLR